MSKGLEALENLKIIADTEADIFTQNCNNKWANIIEQELKALDIFKTFMLPTIGGISFKTRKNFGEDEIAYYILINGQQVYRCKTQEEYDLLKEVLL